MHEVNRFMHDLPKMWWVRKIRRKFLSWYYFGHTKASVTGRVVVNNYRNIHLGDDVWINPGCLLQGYCGITIGSGTVLSPRVMILDANLKRGGGHTGKPVVIGKNVWIGAGAIVCPGVTVADNSIIPAGDVVR